MDGVPDSISIRGLEGCVVDECGYPILARGRCRKHYYRWYKATPPDQRPRAAWVKRISPEQRLRRRVEVGSPQDCWPWTGGKSHGYGSLHVSPERKRMLAHVYALEVWGGLICPPGMLVCHHCDNPVCCNPGHLYIGTHQSNSDDKVRRGRQSRGEQMSGRLSEGDVVAIRVRYADGAAMPDLAGEYRVTDSTIGAIVRGTTWKHVGGPIKASSRRNRSSREHGRVFAQKGYHTITERLRVTASMAHCTTAEIAAELGVTSRTVEQYRSTLRREAA